MTQFVAASKSRVYAADRIGRLVVLDAASGARLGDIAAEGATIKLTNADTDRIYLVSNGGLIQCLREIEQIEPLMHGKLRKEAARAESTRQLEEKPAEHKPPARQRRPRSRRRRHTLRRRRYPQEERPAPKERPKLKPGNRPKKPLRNNRRTPLAPRPEHRRPKPTRSNVVCGPPPHGF